LKLAGRLYYETFELCEVLARVETHLALWNMQKHLHAQNIQLQQELNERKQAEEKLQQRNRELLLLNRVGRCSVPRWSWSRFSNYFGRIQRLLEVFSISFWVIVPETGELVCIHAKGPGVLELSIGDWLRDGAYRLGRQHGESLVVQTPGLMNAISRRR